MEKLKSISLFLAFLCPMACNYLDDPEPTDSLPLEMVFQTAEDLDAALVGVYDLLQSGHLYGRNLIVLPDLMGGNANYQGSGYFGLERYSNLPLQATDWYAENIWVQAYKAINQTNAILAALPEVQKTDVAMSPERAGWVEGEASFLRGILHFELLRLYATPYNGNASTNPGIPYLDKPVLKVEDLTYPARSSVDSVYFLIKRDLEKARLLLPDQVEQGRTGRDAARAFLARVAFQQHDYEQAAAYAQEILEGSFELSATPQDFLNREITNREIILALRFEDAEPGAGDLNAVYRGAVISSQMRQDGYQMIVSAQQLTQLEALNYEVVDLRADTGAFSAYPFLVPDSSKTVKYTVPATGFKRSLDIPLARLAEFLLMRAEALVWLQGLNQESIDLLNQIRRRALRVVDAGQQVVPAGESFIEYKLSDFPDAAALRSAIVLERRVELAFEGNCFHDLMRLKQAVQGYSYEECKLRLPVPQREVDANGNLMQNPCF